MILVLVKEERPMQFFSLISLALGIAAIVLISPILVDYFETGLVPRLPTVFCRWA
jgi:hypothetical protein